MSPAGKQVTIFLFFFLRKKKRAILNFLEDLEKNYAARRFKICIGS